MMKLRSLASRFVLASLVLLPLFLGASGYMLDRSFQQSQQAAEQEQLKSYIYLLMGAAELEDDKLWMPELLTEPRFNTLNSSLIATISDDSGELWRSASALLKNIPSEAEQLRTGQQRFFSVRIHNEAQPSEPWFASSYDVSWQQESGEKLLRFTVLHNRSALQAQLTSYRQQLWQWLGALGILLVLIQLMMMRWGLRPLKTVATDLQEIERGNQLQLEGEYPDEITPVTNNLNRVLSSERQQRERYRNTMGDLAHSLKTPLAVMRGRLGEDEGDPLLEQQVDRMDQIIQHQLQRAIRGNSVTDSSHPVAPIADRLAQTLSKIYDHKSVQFDIQVNESVHFKGDEADLMEMLGNLLENACKYGSGKVLITAENSGNKLELSVEDNGPGITSEQQSTILQRGARADTTQPGHGIGLAVVIDIVSSYNGELRIHQSELGGAKFQISLN